MKAALDTSAYCRLMRGHKPLAACVEHADVVLVPVTVIGELAGEGGGGT